MQFDSVLEDLNYKQALKYADVIAKDLYQAEANLIDRIQKRYLSISSKETPFDVFICYKETDSNGNRTADSVYAQEIYNELNKEGYKTFFARISLEDKLGEAYEPYIFAALNSAKLMLVVGTKTEHMQADWVKNEWKRYLYLMQKDNSKKLIPIYRDMDVYGLPEEFVHMQAQDYGKVGAMQDLLRGVQKIVGKVKPTTSPVLQKPVASNDFDGLMRRAELFLEDSDFKSAQIYYDRVLDKDPENAEAYIGKVCVDYEVNKKADLSNLKEEIANNSNYKKALRFANAEQKAEYKGYNQNIINKKLYSEALNNFKIAKDRASWEGYADLYNKFLVLDDYLDSKEKAEEANSQYQKIVDDIYKNALKSLNEAQTEKDFIVAKRSFDSIKTEIDVNEYILICAKKIAEFEKVRLEQERERFDQEKARLEKAEAEAREKVETEKKEAQRIAKEKKKKTIIITVICAIVVAIAALINFVI